MPFLMVLATVCLLYQVGRMNLEARIQAAPQAVASASDELDHYRAFLYLSAQYMKTHSPTTQTLQLRGSDLLLSLPNAGAFSADAFPSTWHLVVNSASEWVSCTPLSQEAIGMLAQWSQAPQTRVQALNDGVQQSGLLVVGQNLSAAEGCL